ncbi:hypothetical protein N7494_006623 [Penicillium frequentans]|uniref:Uncharacterized protein n=1 Tax=Penicillium frequentans TaxID=3151616 RepID=A0AAD6GEP4_9EURO|nr:hypothetical protein N7494_006623 [Penicillium glabrum]
MGESFFVEKVDVVHKISPPPYWSMDPEELDNEIEWVPQGSQGHKIGVVYRLGECVPVMCNLNGSEVIFTAGGNFYEHDFITFDTFKIIFPETLEDIVAVMKEQGYKTLKFKLLPLYGKRTVPT